MSANFEVNESRRSERIRLPAEVAVDGRTHAVSDWSFHGFSIEADGWHPEVGTQVAPRVILPFDSFKAQIEVVATVRSVSGGTIGFEFVELPHAARVLMREYVEEFVHGKVGTAPVQVADSRFIEVPATSPNREVGATRTAPAPRVEAVALAPRITRYAVLTLLLVALPLAVLAARRYVSSTTAVVAGNAVVLRAQAAGVINQIDARPEQAVAAGAVLVHIDDSDIRRRMDDLQAVQARRSAMIALGRGVAAEEVKRSAVYTQVADSRQVVDQRKVDEVHAAWQQSAAELKRAEELVAAGFNSQASLDGVRATEAQRRAAWEQAQAESQLAGQLASQAQAGRFFATDKVPNHQLEALRDVAAAEVDMARDQLAYAELAGTLALHQATAPVSGKVRLVSRAPGEWVKVGDALAVIDTGDAPWVVASFDAKDAQAMQPGQRAQLYVRATETMFEGRVESIGVLGDDAGASPLAAADRLPGEVPVRIRVDRMPAGVAAGARLEVEVDTGRSPLAWVHELLKFWVR